MNKHLNKLSPNDSVTFSSHVRSSARFARFALVGLLAAFATACAATPPADDDVAQAQYQEDNDPFEPMNRGFFDFNRDLDNLLVRPVAEIYRGALPMAVRDSVTNFLNNLGEPVTLVNDLMQGEVDRAGNTFGRFLTNTFFGVGGLHNVAAGEPGSPPEAGIPYHQEDFGQTLAVYGTGEGPYLVLPILGPRPPRDLGGLVVDSFIDPIGYAIPEESRLTFSITRFGLNAIDFRSRNIETLDEIERTSIDFYAAIRSLYRQRRNAEIRNGAEPSLDELPDLSIEFESDDTPKRVSSLKK